MGIENHLGPFIVGLIVIIGLMTLGIKVLISGWPKSKGNPGNSKKGKCPAPNCSQTVIETATKVAIMETNQGQLFVKVNAIAEDVSFIRGKMDNKEG